MLNQFLSWMFSTWLVFPILVIVLLGLSEFGWRVGLARSRTKPEKTRDFGSVPAAVLTLLGLLLGFTFAMAVSRHDTRRELVVQEANSISTTARRARLLPEPQAANVVRLLREYVALRIEAHRETQFSQRFTALRKSSADQARKQSGGDKGDIHCGIFAVANRSIDEGSGVWSASA